MIRTRHDGGRRAASPGYGSRSRLACGLASLPEPLDLDALLPSGALLEAAPSTPYPVDYALFGLLLALVAGAGIARDRHATRQLAVGALALAAFFVLQDESRLQPWFYQYSFMLAAYCLFGLGRREQAGDPEPILWVDGRPEIISGERSTEVYSCDDVL